MLFVRKSAILAIFIFSCTFFTPQAVFAQQQVTVGEGYNNILEQGIIFANICEDPAPVDGIGDTCICRAQGICSLAQVLQIAVNVIILLLGLSGSVALVMFVYGGWNWIFAQGRPEYLDTGKQTMKNAIIGLAIIFGAYALINLTIAIIGGIAPGASIEDTIENLPNEQENEGRVPLEGSNIIETTN